MQFEKLKPMLYANELKERLAILKQTLLAIRRKSENMPQGHLKVVQKKNHTEYYHLSETGSSCGKYIKNKNITFAAQLAQKDYNLKLIKALETEISALENYLSVMDGKHSVTALYDRLCPARRTLITPVTLTEKQYAEKWQSVIWQGKSFAEDAPQYFTAKQERVRSKSEVIIADTLARYGVPYRYEFPVSLKKDGNLITVYPDFMCLNLRTRDEFFWEHFGMMDDPDYVQKTVSKVSLYAQNGIFPGRGLIISMESSSETLNTKDIEKIIQSFLK